MRLFFGAGFIDNGEGAKVEHCIFGNPLTRFSRKRPVFSVGSLPVLETSSTGKPSRPGAKPERLTVVSVVVSCVAPACS